MEKRKKRNSTGLEKRNGVWWINKSFQGKRLRECCWTSDKKEAEEVLANRLQEIKDFAVLGRPRQFVFRDCALRYIEENRHLDSHPDIVCALMMLDTFIGEIPIHLISNETLQPFIRKRKKGGYFRVWDTRNNCYRSNEKFLGPAKNATINRALAYVVAPLNAAARLWRTDDGGPWLRQAPPLIKLLPEKVSVDKRPPMSLSRENQVRLFAELPAHLANPALFALNTGTRDVEVRNLRWEHEIKLPSGDSVFVLPREFVKNEEDRLIVLNEVARRVVDSQRGKHEKFVFVHRDRRDGRIKNFKTPFNNSAWQKARIRANVRGFRFHDLKHTFGRRLGALEGIPDQVRKTLLGHKTKDISDHYTQLEVSTLVNWAEKINARQKNDNDVTLLELKIAVNS